MRGFGVLEDGFVFTEEELERGTARFWWGPRRRAAFGRALARRGVTSRGREDGDGHAATQDADQHSATSGAVLAGSAAVLISGEGERKTEGGFWFSSWSGGTDGGASSGSDGPSGGGSADAGGSDGGGGSGE